jgi:arylsulfatase A-like enzyme
VLNIIMPRASICFLLYAAHRAGLVSSASSDNLPGAQRFVTAAAATLENSRPNIIWIMADDMGWGEPQVYPSISPHGRISTPNLNAFAKSGIHFTNAYAGYTVCAPSRTTLMSGYHSGHFEAAGLNPGGLTPSWDKGILLPQLLKNAGYATAAIGKIAPLTEPVKSGFDYFFGQIDQGLCHNMYPRVVDTGDQQGNVKLVGNEKIPASTGENHSAARAYCMDPDNIPNLEYTVDLTHQQAMDWIENDANKSRDPTKPFFLYESFTVPHAGGWGWAGSSWNREMECGAPVPTDGQYTNQSWPEVERDHAAVITYLDTYVGDLIALLDSLGIANETIVFFASDNGAHLEGGHNYHFFNSTGGLLGHKRSLYEGGVRSPTMVRWPGVIEADKQSDFAWAFWDVLPTLAELAGTQAPKGIDGESIVPTLLGKTQQAKEYLVWTWPGTGMSEDNTDEFIYDENGQPLILAEDGNGLAYFKGANGDKIMVNTDEKISGYALRSGDWKVVVPYCNKNLSPAAENPTMVFHLPSDPFEANNVNSTSEGQEQIASLLAIAQKHNITCNCYQC